jgi:lysozyme
MISDKGINLIKHFEGVKQRPYRCPANLWTIGVGHVMYPEMLGMKLQDRMNIPLKPEDNRVFTMEEVDDILKRDLSKFEPGVRSICTVPLSQGMLDALTSFSFNLGTGTFQRSTLRQKLNRGDKEGASNEFLKYCMAAGKVLKGLQMRRIAERELFISKD